MRPKISLPASVPVLACLLLAACDGPRPSTVSQLPASPARSPRTAASLPPNPAPTDVLLTNEAGVPGARVPTQEAASEAVKTSDLRPALAAALAETDAPKRSAALEDVAWQAVSADSEVFREALGALAQGGPEAGRLLAHGASRLAAENPAAALAFAQAVAGEAPFAEVAGAIAVALSENDPRGSANLVSRLADGSVQARCAVQVLQRWSAAEPAAAATWVGAFPEGQTRTDGLATVLQSWLGKDPAGLASWVGSPAGESLRSETFEALPALILQQPEPLRLASLQLFPQVRLPPGP